MATVFIKKGHPLSLTVLDVENKSWKEVLCGTYNSIDGSMTPYDGSTEQGKEKIKELLNAKSFAELYPKLSEWDIVNIEDIDDLSCENAIYAEQTLKRTAEWLREKQQMNNENNNS